MSSGAPRLFRALVDSVGLPVLVLNDEGTIEYVSSELTETAQSDRPAPVGDDITEYVPEADEADVERALDRAGSERVAVRVDLWEGATSRFEIVAADGEFLGYPRSVSVPGVTGDHDEPGELARVLEQLHDVTNKLYGSQSISDGLDTVIGAAVEVLGFDWCLLAEATDDVFEIRATSELSPVSVGEAPLTIDEGDAGEVYQSGEPKVTADAKHSSVSEPTHSFIRSTLTVPVGSWGVFQAISKTSDAFDEQELQLAETLVAPLATTIERIEREAQLRESRETEQRQRQQIESLHTVATRMKSATSRDEVYEITIEAVEDILAFDICIIDEVNGNVLVPKAVGSNMSIDDYYEETPLDEPNNLGSLTYREQETFVVDDLHEAGFVPAQSQYSSAISLALGDHGIFQIASEEPAAFDETERRLAELLAEHAVAAIDRIDREQEIERRARELERQNERLDEFASIVSHDLRNPLNVASLRTEHVLRTENTDSLEAVQDALDRMETIIENVLTLARQGEAVEDTQPVGLQYVANRCWEQIPSADASLTVREELVVEADEDRLSRLFENLFRNAIEHSSGEVSVDVGPLPEENGFYVEDDGPGIDEDAREKVFERGYSKSKSGTGLGLAIVESVATAHGWNIRVTEGESGGARFEITGADLAG